MPKGYFKVWARIEVINDDGVYEDLNPEVCEYEVFSSDSLHEVVSFIGQQSMDYVRPAEEIYTQYEAQFGEPYHVKEV